MLSEDNFKFFKQEVSKLLAERSRTETPDQQRPKRLKQVEQEISNILRAIKQGILTPSTKAELQKVERERDRIQEELKDHRSRLNDLALLMPKLKERFEKIVFEIQSLRAHHVDKARAILRNLLGEQIILHPCADGTERFLTAEMSGSYAGLLKLTVGKNKAGGGQGS
ncbi:MAG: pinR [Nitrospira sp.]|nr:pinR [Nitrospira sp.]